MNGPEAVIDASWAPAALLPAAWTLLLGWALFAVLRRFYDPVPRRVVAIFATLVFLLFAPVLVGGMVLLPLGNLPGFAPFHGLPLPERETHALQGDLVHQITPWQAQVRRAYDAGRWPLWNEGAGLGMPLMADPQSQVFQPLVVAGYPLPLSAALGVTGALRILVALVGMFLLLRRQGLGEPSAVFGSVAYGLGGGLMLWLGWPIASSVAWTPMALYGVARCHRVGGRRDVALLAATMVALLLGGHPETVVQSCGFIALFACGCAWERRRAGAPIPPFVLRFCGAIALAGLLVAPVLLLEQRYLPRTDRAAALGWFLAPPSLRDFFAALRELPVLREWERRVEIDLLSTIANRAFGDHEQFWGYANFVEDGSACVGAVVALLAVAAAIRRRQRFSQEGLVAGFGAFCMAVLAQPPYLNRYLGQLPLIGPSAVHNNHRLVLLLGLVAAFLAACEVERWIHGDRGPRRLALAATVVGAALVWAYLGHPPPSGERVGAAHGSWLALQASALAVAAGVLLLLGSRRTGWAKARRAAPWLLVVVLAAELGTLHGDALAPGPARLYYPWTPSLRFLRSHIGTARFAGMGSALPANFSQMYGLNDVRIDNPARPQSYSDLVGRLRDPGEVTLSNYNQIGQAGSRLYDLLGVRYVVTDPGVDLGLPIAYRDSGLWIYEHPRPMPRFFLPPSATAFHGRDWLAWLTRPRDFVARALVSELPAGNRSGRWRARQAPRAQLQTTRHEPARWSARTSAPERRLLGASILQDGGWRLLVDGQPHATVLVDGPLVGAWLPGGRHRLELLYRPAGLAAGCVLLALALATALAWVLPPPRHRARGAEALRRAAPAVAAVLVAIVAGAAPAAATELPPGFSETVVATGLQSPTAMAIAADGRIFVCEQKGALRVIRDGQLLAAPFVNVPVDGQRERGLIGVTLHPDFPHTPYVYVYYTAFKPTVHNRLSRYTASGDRALGGSEKVLVDFPPLERDIHNGGALHFGPDGRLYVGVGENGISTNAQSLAGPLGKILRFDENGGIPTDGPFYGATNGLARAIWAYGLRNPFTFAFDRDSARLFVNDVGFRTWEEIDEIVPGGNYGWPVTEGPTSDPAFRGPLFAYRHGPSAETGCAIAGGAFYDPAVRRFPASFAGNYLFADFCSGWIRRLDPAAGNAVSGFATGIDGPVDLRVAADGALYYLAYGFRHGVGSVGRIVFTGSEAPTIAAQPQGQRVAVGSPATFRVEASGTPPLSYQWRRDGAPIAGATAAAYTLAAAALADDGARFSVVVGNASGTATSDGALLTVVAGTAPHATIVTPAAGTTYAGGDAIAYTGSAGDAEDGALPPSAYTWRIDFHHDEHLHPYVPSTSGATGGTFTAFTDGETAAHVWFRVHLDVVDSTGLAASTFVDVLPRTSRFTLAADPPGLQVTLDGTPYVTPLTELGVVGVRRTLGAPSPQSLGGASYELVAWSDGGAPTHVLSTPAGDATYVATFRAATATHGLFATYYAGAFATPLLSRVDSRVDFNWRGGRPAVGVPADGFSVRWEGEVQAPATGAFTFHLRSDDGARLWVDGRLVIDDWGPHGEHTARGVAPLAAGQRYPIVLEYREESGAALVRLLWSGPGVPRQVVPASSLFPASSARR